MHVHILKALALTVALLLIATAITAHADGFAAAGAPAVHTEYGKVNAWATAFYADAPKANISWNAGEVPDIVFDPSMTIRLYFTSDSGNWKDARVGSVGQQKVSVPLHGEGRGDVLTADIPADRLIPECVNGFVPIIGQRASNRRIIPIPFTSWGIGKQSIRNEDFGLLRCNLVVPLTGPDSMPDVSSDLGISQKEAWIIAFSSGYSGIGQVSRDWLRQLLQHKMTNPSSTKAVRPSADSAPRLTSRNAQIGQQLPSGKVVALGDFTIQATASGAKYLRWRLVGINCRFDGRDEVSWDAPANTSFTIPKWFEGAEATLYVSASDDGSSWSQPAAVKIRFGGAS